MSNVVLDVISRLTGNEFLSKCIKLCEFEDLSEIINIDEKTLDNMEIFLQKKCTRMPLNERRNFIGDNFAQNPDLFKFSPGIRNKFLNVLESLSKIFSNPNLPVSVFNLKEACQRLEINNRSSITSVPRNALKMVLSKENFSTELINNIPSKSTDEVVITDVNYNILNKKPLESYPNIFQRMDLLRKGETDFHRNVEAKSIEERKKSFSPVKQADKLITNKENEENKEQSVKVSKKRKADDDPDYQEPIVKKKFYEYRKYNRKPKFNASDSTTSSSSVPLRTKSQRLMEKNRIAEEPRKPEQPVERVKRKYTKRAKLPIAEQNPISEAPSQKTNLENAETRNSPISPNIYKLNGEISSKLIHFGGKLAIANNFQTSVENRLKLSTNENNKIPHFKIPANNSQIASKQDPTSFPNNIAIIAKRSSNVDKISNHQPIAAGQSNRPIQSNLAINSIENPARQFPAITKSIKPLSSAQNVIVQPKIISTSQLKINILTSSPDTTIQSIKQLDGNIATISAFNQPIKPIKPSGLKLSDVPFQCFEVNPASKRAPISRARHIQALTKANNNGTSSSSVPRISIKPSPVQQNGVDIDSKINNIDKPPIVSANHVKVIQIPKNPISNQQIFQPSSENFADQINPIKSTSSSNFRFEPVKLLEKSILSGKTPTVINSGGLQTTPDKMDNFKHAMDSSSLDISMNPQWTSTPNFFANRFINATKHQKSTSESARTGANKSQSDSNNFVSTPKQYRY